MSEQNIFPNQHPGLMPVGARGTVKQIRGGKEIRRKLMSLGIRAGSEIEILHHRGKGVVVRSKGTRIAIGESIAQYIEVESEHQKVA